ncbi:formylglycine-generating enzyme family protein [Roseibium aggregatum]|uniref:SUMF1/EgtB/PvdO family nonheme iron enzyme n=1 Tax=Roseibium aggregatum TaxID=187304 RepID=A0A939J3P3_9HYPH|nr:SUMF1/EgtB/PvdO family nonheme iron enzyme [Roseibium aggregatum]MBN9670797.1 SUMF1/EgtB/PvdO family nonheme iron enzyme [Roseibium aggregatum]
MSIPSATDYINRDGSDFPPRESAPGTPKDANSWLQREANDLPVSASEETGSPAKTWDKARKPAIKWHNDDDEIQTIPEVFRRQDAPDAGEESATRAVSFRWIAVFTALLVTTALGGVLYFSGFGGYFQESGEGSETSAAATASRTTQNLAETNREEINKAREALKAAMVGRGPSPKAVEPAETTAQAVKTQAGENSDVAPTKTVTAASPQLPRNTANAGQNPDAAKATAPFPDMVSIPAGTYQVPLMRADNVLDPERMVTIGAFAIGRHEVSRADWLQCVAAGACPGEGFDEGYFAAANTDLPITSITYDQTMAYIEWLNSQRPKDTPAYRLPSDAEWVVAARGASEETRNFAWGDRFDPAYVRKTGELVPVSEAETINGLTGIVGNAEERTSDCWTAEMDTNGCYRGLGVVRGAPLGEANQDTVSMNFRLGKALEAPYSSIGFRLAR